MPVPKRKTGKTRRNTRRAHDALTAHNLSECSECGERVISHRVCPKCGSYNKRIVMNVDNE